MHESYTRTVERYDSKLLQQLQKNPDFLQLSQLYYQRLQFNPIKFDSMSKSAATNRSRNPINQVSKEFLFLFDYGQFYKK